METKEWQGKAIWAPRRSDIRAPRVTYAAERVKVVRVVRVLACMRIDAGVCL